MDPGPFCTIKTGPQGQKVLKVVINLRVKHDLQFSQVVCCVSVQKLTNHSAECLLLLDCAAANSSEWKSYDKVMNYLVELYLTML